MSRTLRISLAIGAAVVVLLAITPFLIPVNQFRPTIERKASEALGRPVALGPLSLSVWHQSVTAETLTVGDDPAFSTSPFLTAKAVKVGVELFPLVVSRSINVTGITVEQPEVTLLRNGAGRWNYASLGSSAASSEFSIKMLELRDGRMLVGSTRSSKRSTYEHVTVTASEVSLASRCPVTATATLPGGGAFELNGHIGPVNQADASLTPLDATIAMEGLNLATTGFLDPALGLGGLLDLKATMTSKTDQAEIAGRAILSKALLVAGGSPASQPLVVEFKSTYDLHTQSGVLHPSTLKIGNAAGRLNGTYNTRGDYTIVSVNFAGERMPATDLESFLPALGIHLPQGANLTSGTLTANLSAVGATNRLVTTGNVGLYNARLSGFDLGAKVRAISDFAGLKTGTNLDIQTLTTNLRIAPDGLRFDHFNAVVPAVGQLTGVGTIDARNRLDFKMVATLTSSLGGSLGTAIGTTGAFSDLLGAITGRDARGSKGKSQSQRIPFVVRGTTTNPEFVPDVSGVVFQMLKEQLGMKH